MKHSVVIWRFPSINPDLDSLVSLLFQLIPANYSLEWSNSWNLSWWPLSTISIHPISSVFPIPIWDFQQFMIRMTHPHFQISLWKFRTLRKFLEIGEIWKFWDIFDFLRFPDICEILEIFQFSDFLNWLERSFSKIWRSLERRVFTRFWTRNIWNFQVLCHVTIILRQRGRLGKCTTFGGLLKEFRQGCEEVLSADFFGFCAYDWLSTFWWGVWEWSVKNKRSVKAIFLWIF